MKSRLRINSLLKLSVLLVAGVCCWQTVTPRAAQAGLQRQLSFNRDIRPILAEKCFVCHGPDAPAKKIKLRLDSEAAATAELGQGRRAIVAGQPQQSELVRRITAQDEAERMPPSYATHKLTQAEIELLIEWIKQGAHWQQHWAFIPPVKSALPTVTRRAWPRNAIDYFVLARLEPAGLQPAPEADRATLLRRVTLDLTGLPPTLRELDDFLNDRAPNAYEKVVERLLASPRYGERLAFKWLDAARYADTNGYQIDGDREMWRWRDWVIEAFNANKPYDQFIIEQLAGDLLPNATLEQRLATAFNRNHRINAEGGIVPEEYRLEYVVDRVDTTATVFMGLTLGCARCHNHKYDPFTQREYYQLTAYFNSIDEDGHSFDQGNSPPLTPAPTRAQQRQLQLFDEQLKQAAAHYQHLITKSLGQRRRWEKSLLRQRGVLDGERQRGVLDGERHWFPDEKLIVRAPFDEARAPVFNKSDRAHHDQYDRRKDEPEQKFETGFKEGAPRYLAAPTGQGVAFDGKLYFDGGIHADFRYKSTSKDYRERFTIAAWVYPEAEQSGSIVTKVSDSPAEVEDNVPRAEGYGLYFLNGKIHFNLVFRWGEDTLRVETEDRLPLKQWQHVAVVFDGLQQWEERVQIFVNGQPQKLRFNQRNFFLLFGGTKNTLKIGAGGGPQFRFKGAMDEVRLYSRALAADEIAVLACADALAHIAAIPAAKRTPAQALKLERAFLAQAAPAELQQAHRQLAELKQRRQSFVDDLPTVMVMQELPQPRPTFVLKRGAYDAPGERVERAVPAVLPPWPKDAPHNRLGLARWLTGPDHPLTARVAVNRFWQMLFGAGLVKTSEDFGTQGALPTHPELLDYLAAEFRAQGWDIKRLLKTIVLSATYRQSSQPALGQPAPGQPESDNDLLNRGARYRLAAEVMRDQALFVAGLLVERLGGPSVKPYQPEGLYRDMAFSGLTAYARDKGEGLWRRSLYTYWKRTVLAPAMQVFDASAREFCTVRETRTNTPLQALNLMNDVTYLEAARMFAERMLKEGGETPSQRLTWAFRVVTARRPNERELQVLLRNLTKQQEHFSRNPQEATKLLAVGEKRNDGKLGATELAAYAATASLLLNLDEVITRQ